MSKTYLKFGVVFLFLLSFGYTETLFAQSQSCKPFDFKLAPRYQAGANSTAIQNADINGDAFADLVTANSDDRTISVLIGTGSGAFGPSQNFSTQIDANALALGDLNGDGRVDAVVGSNSNVNQFAVLLNNGNAGFGPASLITTSSAAQQIYDIKIADFSSDGIPDLAILASNNLLFFLGNGQGGFTLNTTIPWIGRFANLSVGDINSDSIADIAVTRSDVFNSWAFAIVLGNSGGSFTISSTFPLDAAPSGIQFGSFNGDAFPDIVVSANYDFQPAISDPFYVQTWVGTGNANFVAGPRIGLPQRTAGLATSDFDLNGGQDLAVNLSSFIAKLNGSGNGTFAVPAFWMSSGSISITAIDANQDGRNDIVALRKGTPSTASVLITKPDGAFETPRPVLGGGTHIVAADMNSDGFKDMVTATATGPGSTFSSIVIAANDQSQGFSSEVSTGTSGYLTSLELGNINNDDKADVFTTHGSINIVAGYLGNGTGGLVPLTAASSQNRIDMVIPGYFNADANQDFMYISADQGYIFLGNGNGTYQNLNYSIGVINPFVRPQVGDFNEDGKNDLAVVAPQQDGLRIYLGTGDGHFTLTTTFPIGGFQSMVKGDFNGDGNLDIAGITSIGSITRASKYFGDGNGGFSGSAVSQEMAGRASSVVAGDFNGDQLDDLAFVSYGQNGSLIVIASIEQTPPFGAMTVFPVGGLGISNLDENTSLLVAADFNNDNKIDIGFTEKGVSRGVLFNITDPNVPCISINDITITENDSSSSAIFTVSLSGTSVNAVSVNFAVRDVTTTIGQDLQNRFGRLEIPAGQTVATITVPIVGDLLDEFDEQFRVSLSDASNAFLVKDSGLGTILDNDEQPTLTISDVEVTEVQVFEQAVFNVSLSAPSGKTIDFRYATTNGTAVSGLDYSSTSQIKTIPAGTAATTVAIQIFTDTMYEPTEDFFVNLSQPVNVSIGDNQAKATIIDNDPIPTFTITAGSVTEPDTGFVNRTVTIRLSNSTYLPVTGNSQSRDGTAIAGSDYTVFNAPFSFAPGTTQLTAQVRVLGDNFDEPNEAFFINASDIVNATAGNSQAEITIIDDDNAIFNFDGDRKADLSVWRPSDGTWYILQSQSQSVRAQGWGLDGDKLAPADFDGDGKTDLAVFRESDSNWYIFNSSTNTASVAGWGLAGDMPVPADYGGDGKADLAVYRPSEGKWYRRDSDGKLHIYEWGLPGDKPAPADFNGDGVADMTVFRPSEGKWYTINSGNAAISEFTWGLNGDLPIPGDYSGDGKSDFAVFRPSNQTWYRIHSDTFQIHIITWGLPGDFPTPGDYDGDGRSDLAVFRPSNSTWFINSSTGGIYSQPFGLTGDVPVENAFVY